jgi:hypothetical protein
MGKNPSTNAWQSERRPHLNGMATSPSMTGNILGHRSLQRIVESGVKSRRLHLAFIMPHDTLLEQGGSSHGPEGAKTTPVERQ